MKRITWLPTGLEILTLAAIALALTACVSVEWTDPIEALRRGGMGGEQIIGRPDERGPRELTAVDRCLDSMQRGDVICVVMDARTVVYPHVEGQEPPREIMPDVAWTLIGVEPAPDVRWLKEATSESSSATPISAGASPESAASDNAMPSVLWGERSEAQPSAVLSSMSAAPVRGATNVQDEANLTLTKEVERETEGTQGGSVADESNAVVSGVGVRTRSMGDITQASGAAGSGLSGRTVPDADEVTEVTHARIDDLNRFGDDAPSRRGDDRAPDIAAAGANGAGQDQRGAVAGAEREVVADLLAVRSAVLQASMRTYARDDLERAEVKEVTDAQLAASAIDGRFATVRPSLVSSARLAQFAQLRGFATYADYLVSVAARTQVHSHGDTPRLTEREIAQHRRNGQIRERGR